MQQRVLKMPRMEQREEAGKIYLSGYFAVFSGQYQVDDTWFETIRPGAFRNFLAGDGDVKALWNHNHDIVLGSRASGTLTLTEDDNGLYGVVEINRDDTDAMNAYARILRGDVTGCSFGFDAEFDCDTDANGIFHTQILEVTQLYEVSPCTFPAYPSTSITARCREELTQTETEKLRRSQEWRSAMLKKLRGE